MKSVAPDARRNKNRYHKFKLKNLHNFDNIHSFIKMKGVLN